MLAVRLALIARHVARLAGHPLDRFTPEVRRVVTVEVSSALLAAAFTGLTAPFTGVFLRGVLHASPVQIAVASAGDAAFMLPFLVWAKALHGRSPLPCVVWAGFTARALYLLTPAIHTAWPFVGILVAGSLLGAVASPAYSVLVETVYPREQRGHALGVVRMAGSMLAIALSPVAGRLIGLAGYPAVFAAAAVVGMAGSLRQRAMGSPALSRAAHEVPGTGWRLWSAANEDPMFRRVLVAAFVFGLGIWLQAPAYPLMLVDLLHATALQIGIVAAVGSVVGLIGNTWWGRIVDRRSSVGVLRIVYIVGLTSPLIYLMGLAVRSPWILVGTAAADALTATGLDIVSLVTVMDFAGPRRSAQYMATYQTLAGVRGVVGPLLSALVVQRAGIAAVYPLAAAAMLAAARLASVPLE